IATCVYIVVQFLKLTPSQESSDHMYYIMVRNGTELKTKYSFVVTLRILFSILGAVMIGTLVYTLVTDGSPFRKELLTLGLFSGSKIDSYFNYADRGLGSRPGCLGKYLAPIK
ncbi:hypothetical protein A2U01_0005736, partial [Trifolium medium]|nr:hypothetical protein [Trifolium medium]